MRYFTVLVVQILAIEAVLGIGVASLSNNKIPLYGRKRFHGMSKDFSSGYNGMSDDQLRAGHSTAGSHFGYDKQEDWGGDCTTGNAQSPIDVVTSKVSVNHQFSITLEGYKPKMETSKMKNNGHTVQVNIPSGKKVTLKSPIEEAGFNEEYNLAQFHFHWGTSSDWGTEHAVDGHRSALELHFVHVNSKAKNVPDAAFRTNGLFVLTVMFKEGNGNDLNKKAVQVINDLVKQNPKLDEEVTVKKDLFLRGLMPEKGDFYIYKGSLTTPICAQSVVFAIFKGMPEIPKETLDYFRALKGEEDKPIAPNMRNLQPLNGRFIFMSKNITLKS